MNKNNMYLPKDQENLRLLFRESRLKNNGLKSKTFHTKG